MASFLQRFGRKRRVTRASAKKQAHPAQATTVPAAQGVAQSGDIAPNNPIIADLPGATPPVQAQEFTTASGDWQVLQTYQLPSEAGNERLAMAFVAETVKPFHLSERRLEQLGTAVAEATMNAMEHGNHYNPEIPVTLQILSSDQAIAVHISDKGGSGSLPAQEEYEAPDIEAKLAELQSPRGWGLFLIQNMVDEMHVLSDKDTHTIELILRLEGNA